MVIGGKWRKNIDINMQQTNCTTLDSENTEYRHLLKVNSKYLAACVVLEMGNCISHNVFRITTHSANSYHRWLKKVVARTSN